MTRLGHLTRLRRFRHHGAEDRRAAHRLGRLRHSRPAPRVPAVMDRPKVQRPVRVGVFQTVSAADRAVRGLLDAGFTQDEISVVCSVEAKERHFRAFGHDKPAGTTTPATAAAGGVLGAMAGGLAVIGGLVLTGGLGVVAMGPLLVATGSVFGTFVGAMMSRGLEREVANFYDQHLRGGEILVAAEIDAHGDRERLDVAERVFREAGARPLKLPSA